jgi:phage tail P2-like protein
MKLADIDLTKLLPQFMKNDPYDKLLAEALSNEYTQTSQDLDRIIIVGRVDKLNEAELDQIAHDSNIFWYSEKADIAIKRNIIKNAPLVFNRLGTVYAVEKVMSDYLKDAELLEWWEYNSASRNHFSFRTTDIGILRTDIEEFLWILEKVKRKSQWLEAIILQLKVQGNLYPGIAVIDKTTYKINFGVEEGN